MKCRVCGSPPKECPHCARPAIGEEAERDQPADDLPSFPWLGALVLILMAVIFIALTAQGD